MSMAELNPDEVEKIVENTLLSEREAQVYLLKQEDMSRTEIANKFDLNKNTVDEYNKRIRDKSAEAKRTLELKSNINNSEDFKQYMRSSYDNIEFDDTSNYTEAQIITDGLGWQDLTAIRSSGSISSIQQKDSKIEIKLKYFKDN